MTVEELRKEVMLLTPENIQHYPCTQGMREDFRSLWNKCGPAAGRDIMMVYIWRGQVPRPSEFFGK